jgi:DNA-binding IclR family transcriptional regulator
VHRIRAALEREGFIATDAATGRLRLGPGIVRLAMAERDLPTEVRPHPEHLAGICGVGMAVRDVDGGRASISVLVPATRFHQDPDAVIAAQLRVRDEAQSALKGG